MKQELKDECDYEREASFLRKFGSKEFLGGDGRFKVPWVWEQSTRSVLVMEYAGGSSVGGNSVHEQSQQDRDDVSLCAQIRNWTLIRF
jgi:aarF domain-containing kinase